MSQENKLFIDVVLEVSATGRSLTQRSPTDCGCVTVCDHMKEKPSTPKLVRQKEVGLRKKKVSY